VPYVSRASGCHAFRHALASIVHRETGSLKYAQKQLGHSNIATTGNIYPHVADDEMDLVAQAIGKALSGFCGRSVVEMALEKEVVQ